MSDFTDQLDEPEPPPKIPDHWDPPEGAKTWVRHSRKGDEGWLVRRQGLDYVHYNRPNEVIEVPYNKGEWLDREEQRPMNDAQMAMVAFGIDRDLCGLLGSQTESRRSWIDLGDEEKIRWMSGDGPPDNCEAIRSVMYDNVMAVLRAYSA